MRQRIPGTALRGLALLLLGAAGSATAQGLVVRDGSIGVEPPGIVQPGVDDFGQPADYLISADLGEQRGGNLFHSFEQLSVGTGETATFTDQGLPTGHPAIDNVISRVTGTEQSQVDGTIRSTIDGADIWLMNPNGVVFGDNARLDVRAGFHASSADSLALGNGEVFEARAGAPLPLLAVDPPEAFGFLETNVAPIEVANGAALDVEVAALSLEGNGKVTIAGSVSANGADDGGQITIRGDTIALQGLVSVGDGAGSGGSALLEARNVVTISGTLSAGGGQSGGDVTIRGLAIAVERSGVISADGFGGGSVLLEGPEAVKVEGNVSADGDGMGGEVAIRAPGGAVRLERTGVVSADAFSFEGSGGHVLLEGQRLRLDGQTSVRGGEGGDPGSLTLIGEIEPPGRVLRDGSLGDMPAGPVPSGSDGEVFADYLITPELGRLVGHNLFHSFSRFDLFAGEVATFTGPEALRNIVARVTGNDLSEIDGTVRSTAPNADLYLLNPAGIVFGEGGQLDAARGFHASTADRLALRQGELTEVFEARLDGAVPTLETALPGAFGFLATNVAPITVSAFLAVRNGASLSLEGAGSVTLGGFLSADGESGGTVTIRGDTIEVNGIATAQGVSGSGGNVLLEGQQDVAVQGFISANGENGGTVTVRGDSIVLNGGAATAEGFSGSGGSVLVEGQHDVTVQGFVSVSGYGGGGDVTIRSPEGIVALEDFGFIGADAFAFGQGDGGHLLLEGQRLRLKGQLSVKGAGGGSRGTVTLLGQIERDTQGGVVRDGSLGQGPTGVVAAGFDGDALVDYLITPELGRLAGHNLFHSFSGFDVFSGEVATFTGPEALRTIVARVTGSDLSEIYGTVRSTAPNADLYLLNPAGIVFGQGVQLDVARGFHASTADRLEFREGEAVEMFEAQLDGAVPTLETALPGAFGFLATNVAPITVEPFAFLAVRNGASLSLEGAGAVTLGGTLSANGESGRGGTVTVRGDTIALDGGVTADSFFGNGGSVLVEGQHDVKVQGIVSANGESGGTVTLRGDTIAVNGGATARGFSGSGGSVLVEGQHDVTVQGFVSATGESGGTVTLRGETIAVNGSATADGFSGSGGSGGSVLLDGQHEVTVTGSVSASGYSGGGDVAIRASEGLIVLASSGRLEADAFLEGDGGHLFLEGQRLRLKGQLNVQGAGGGNPGTITLIGEMDRGVVRDGSLGGEPAGAVPSGFDGEVFVDYLITPELGRLAGHNLFHSFSRFDVFSGETATFTGPEALRTIVARVTGSDLSEIDGTVRSTAPNADLYLLNPAGIVFGQGAQLDVARGFHASTADRLEFREGEAVEMFEAQLDGAVPTLETALPGAFGFLGTNVAPITVEPFTFLGVRNGASLSLEGAGAVTIGSSLSADGENGGGVTVRGNTIALQGATASGFSGSGGSVLLEGQHGVTITGSISASGGSGGGDVTIRSPDGIIALEDFGFIGADAFFFGQGDGGHLFLEGQRLRLKGQLSVEGAEGGSRGTVTLLGQIERDRQGGVVRDGSLGQSPPGVVPIGFDGEVLVDYLITPELGRLAGHNLFHSFSRFDVFSGETATFTGPEALRTIVARVTGSDLSEIDGTVRSTAPNADLYLLNPAGIVFGQGAQLDVAKGFHASTADRLEFREGEAVEVFEAHLDGAVPTLETALPGAFGFLATNVAPITVEPPAFLAVRNGASLSLEGAGSVTVGGFLSADGENGGGVTVRGNTIALQGATASGSSSSGGSVLVEGQHNVTVQGFVSVSGYGGGGDVTIRSPEGIVALEDFGVIQADAFAFGQGDGGHLLLEGQRLRLNGQLSVKGAGGGSRGTVTLLGQIERDTQGGVVRDGSLGPSLPGAVPGGFDGEVLADYLITPELGRLAGHNLFHSFSRFDVFSGETATFTGPEALQTIVARVTGNDLSEIDGTLRSTAPNADLYLLNPAGIVFGQGARLDVAGGFHASTADRLEFREGEAVEVFEAHLDGAVPTLETALPGAFGFLGTNVAPITVEPSAFLAVRNGASLSLEGAGAVTVGGFLSADGESGGTVTVRGDTIALQDATARGFSGSGGSVLLEGQHDVTVQGFVSANGENGGTVTLRGETIAVNGSAGADGVLGSGGSVLLEGQHEVTITGSISASGNSGGGDITIRSPDSVVALEDFGVIQADAFGQGDGGHLSLEGQRLRLNGQLSVKGAGGGSRGTVSLLGPIERDTQGGVVRDGSLGPSLPGVVASGFDGEVFVDYLITPELGRLAGHNLFHSFARFDVFSGETATFTGPEALRTIVARVTGSDLSEIDGTVRSTAPNADLYLLNPAGIVFGQGAQLDVAKGFHASTADRLEFREGEAVEVFEAQLDGAVPTLETALPGDFGFLARTNPAAITVDPFTTLAVRNGASLSLEGAGAVTLGGTLSADGESGGTVTVRGDTIALDGGIAAHGFSGSGGSVLVEGQHDVTVRGFVSANGESGEGGTVTVRGDTIALHGGVTADSLIGDGGSVLLEGQHDVTARGFVSTNGGGSGGTVTVRGDSIALSGVVTAHGFSGNGGSVTVRGDTIAVNGSATAHGFSGSGGSVLLEGQHDVTVRGSISASGQSGGGDITIRSPDSVVALEDFGFIGADAFFFGQGDGGHLFLEGQRLRLNGQLSVKGAEGGSRGTVTLLGQIERDTQGGVVRDGSLGPSLPGAVPSGFDGEALADYLIAPELGRLAGHNLFHSFARFDVFSGETATFTGPEALRTIVARVTGSDLSEIDGTVRSTAPNADLYLLNPAGIVFGQGAQLDVARGFHASTADRLEFREGEAVEVFETHPGGAVPTLETALPGEFGFLARTNPAAITVDPFTTLAVRNGASLSLEGAGAVTIGGTLSADGESGGTVTVRGDSIALDGGVGGVGVTADSFFGSGGTILVEGQHGVTVTGLASATGDRGGDVTIRGGTVSLETSGLVRADGFSSGGRVLLDATEAITIVGNGSSGGFPSSTSVSANGEGGEIHLRGRTVTLDGAAIGFVAGLDPGTIRIEARGDVEIKNDSFVSGWSFGEAGGGRGEIHVVSDGDILIEKSTLTVASVSGTAGSISVRCSTTTCTNRLELRNHGLIDAGGFNQSFAQGGDIQIHVGTLELDLESAINAGGFSGAAGNVDIRGDVAIGIANTGGVQVDFLKLLREGGYLAGITALSLGSTGGTVHLDAPRVVVEEGARIWVQSGLLGGGGGSILLEGDKIEILSGASLDGSALFPDGGSIELRGGQSITIAGTGVDGPTRIRALAAAGGVGGSILVEAPVIVLDGGGIATSATGATTGTFGESGDVTLTATETITLEGGARVDTSTFSPGHGGAVLLTAPSITIEGTDTGVSARAAGEGDGGQITIDAGDLTVRAGATISAESRAGSAELEEIFADSTRLANAVLEFLGEQILPTPLVASGGAGIVQVFADRVTLDSKGSIVASTSGPGSGGDIVLNTSLLELSGASSIAAESVGSGDAGSVRITADQLLANESSSISAEAQLARAGSVFLSLSDLLRLEGGKVLASSGGAAEGGGVEIDTARLEMTNGSLIATESTGSGDGGSITIRADDVYAEGISRISGRATSADGGNVTLFVADRVHLVDSEINAQAGVDGGRIAIGIEEDDPAIQQTVETRITPRFVILDDSSLVAKAAEDGGTIRVRTDSLIRDPKSVIDASSEQGPELDGTVDINAPDVDLAGTLAGLSESALDASDQLAERCSARRHGETEGSFTVAGGALRPGPEGWLPAWSPTAAPPIASLALTGTRCR